MKESDFKFSTSVIAWPLFFVLMLWGVYLLEVILPGDLLHYGVLPRTVSGAKGILFSVFLHGDMNHLWNNSVSLFVLLMALRYFYRTESLKVLVWGVILSGVGTWLIGRESYHIGASGLVYVLASFMFFEGFQTKHYRLMALSFAIVLMYGGMIWYMFPSAEVHISWEAHLSGFLAGFVLSRMIDSKVYEKPIVYDWQHPDFDPTQDEFMRHFDENGNFAPKPKEPEILEEDEMLQFFNSNFPVFYHYKEEKKDNQ